MAFGTLRAKHGFAYSNGKIFMIVKPVFAEIYNPAVEEGRPGPENLATYIGTFLQAGLIIGGLLVLAMLVFGGLQYITSQGDKMAVDKAKNIISYALIGLVILVAIIPVIKIIETVLGISILEITWPGEGLPMRGGTR